jgi:hypothetical protein
MQNIIAHFQRWFSLLENQLKQLLDDRFATATLIGLLVLSVVFVVMFKKAPPAKNKIRW